MTVSAARLRMFILLSVVVLSSVSALPIDRDLEDNNRRNDIGLAYREMKRVLDEVFQTGKRMDPFAGKTTEDDDDDYDLEHYQDQDLDYGLLERLTNEMLAKNGGDLDRGLTDTEYEDISEIYFKRLAEERTSEKANAWQTPPNTEYDSKKFGTTWATPPKEAKSSEDGNKTPADDGKTTSHQDVHRPTTPGQNVITTPVTPRDEWWTTPTYSGGPYWPFWGFKTPWETWKAHTTDRGTDSFKASDHTKHFDWTGESKSGHRVHVVVYFEK